MVYVTVKTWELPKESYTLMGDWNVPFTAVDPFRFVVREKLKVAAAGAVVPVPTLIGCKPEFGDTTPFTAGYPMTVSPPRVISWPAEFVVKSPLRVYVCAPDPSWVTKKPAPFNAMFELTPVDATAPLLKSCDIPVTCTPRPVSIGLPLPLLP